MGVGETGLDFYRDYAPHDLQEDVFRWHIRLALDRGLPLVVHSRGAEDRVLEILAEEAPDDNLSADGVPFAVPGRFAETFDAGLQAYEADRPDRAYRLWLSIAKQGDLAAMRNLGYLLEHGLGIEAAAHAEALYRNRW